MRINPRGLPHWLQRFRFRVENLGALFDFSIKHFLAIISVTYFLRKGILKLFNNAKTSPSFDEVVSIVMLNPRDVSTLS